MGDYDESLVPEAMNGSPQLDLTIVRWAAVPFAPLLGALVYMLTLAVLEAIATQLVGLNLESPFSRILLLPLPSFADAVVSIAAGTALAPRFKRRTATLLTLAVSLVALGRMFVILMSHEYIMLVRCVFMLFGVYVTREFLRELLTTGEA